MFGKKQKKTIEVTKLSSLVADNLHVVGDVLFSGGLRIDGKVEGNVLGKRGEKSLVVLSEKGCIVGRVNAYDAVINGTVTGDLEVEHFLELQPGARIFGNISYRQLQMECGATVDGKLLKVDDGKVDANNKAAKTATTPPVPPAGAQKLPTSARPAVAPTPTPTAAPSPPSASASASTPPTTTPSVTTASASTPSVAPRSAAVSAQAPTPTVPTKAAPAAR